LKKHDHGKDGMPSLPGIVTLLESTTDQPQLDGETETCRKVSDTIYQCLAPSGCRYKFTYETIHLCSWPSTGSAERTPGNIPCRPDPKDHPHKG
jgi:hypothetical protein